ncbi:tumor necrosis factor b (TNF superfamily, member 2) [Rhinichthys klamathensis goyatoka]|uniref:tumor necrosis factor b (TNF superfamily, member 2) n=1 Tax=Rhinichthys klamathensis goyatoka TaxID=3034132 RepID=UPI0024B4D331|nr:tumor necrosis factor b (TNF superfamily, member 2) [Rhinichthys klamathensis goyatoka]
MVKYETTVDVGASAGGVYQTTVAPVPVKSSRSWIWKTVAAVVFVCLCTTAALFFAWHTKKTNQTGLQNFPEKQISTTTSEQGIMLKQIAENTKAAIHLHGERYSNQESDLLKWVGGVDQSFAQGGLELVNNEIRIPADGLYFVYSQVSYAIKCNMDEDDDDAPLNFLSHSIYRYTNAVGKEMPLQNSAHSVCQSNEDGKTVYSTVYLGAVFQLMEGDMLSTKTTRVVDVEDEYAKTFFGVFAL